MPEITINNKAYPLRFGMGFLRLMNEKRKREIEPGVYQNIGLQFAIAEVIDGSIEALADIILTANKTESDRISLKDLDAFLEDEETDLRALKKEVLGFLEKANVTRPTLNLVINRVTLALSQIPATKG